MNRWDSHEKILRNAKENVPTLYMPIELSRFDGWTVKQPCVERLAVMDDYLFGRDPGTVVDVGCHTGFLCREFARRGWRAVGIEPSREWIAIAFEMNKEIRAGRVFVDPGPVPSYVCGTVDEVNAPTGDVVLCLSAAMYFFRNRSIAEGWATMRKVSGIAPTMFFDFGGQYAGHLPFGEDDAIRAIVENTDYAKGEHLGHTGFEDRPMYAFERSPA